MECSVCVFLVTEDASTPQKANKWKGDKKLEAGIAS